MNDDEAHEAEAERVVAAGLELVAGDYEYEAPLPPLVKLAGCAAALVYLVLAWIALVWLAVYLAGRFLG